MTMVHNPPPQAYTRDTITQAYEWLQTQPSHIRELACNTDGMVSMYLQAKRRGTTSGPVSAENFKQDLKTLAEGMRQFEEKAALRDAMQTVIPTAPMPAAPSAMPSSAQRPAPSNPATASYTTTEARVSASNTNETQFDPRTQQILNQVRTKLNLSSNDEALRMLITIGYERLSEILPKN